jgi:hypothetical protein
MLYLKCTLEVQKAIGLRKENLAASTETEALLGNWYVNRFDIGHRKAFIFMSQLVGWVERSEAQRLPREFVGLR